MSAQIDPHNIVLYRSVYTGTQIDTLLGLIRPAKDLAEGLEVRVRTIEDQLSPKVILTIQQMEFAGGTSVQSPAGGEVIAVEDLARGYKLYFDTNNGSEPVLFHVNDQAMGRRYDIGTTVGNYYWRLVTEVGADYIVLSKTDCDAGSGVPAVGDKVITLGARYDTTRQNVKVSTTIGENRDEWYAGINTYNLENKLVTVVGVKDGQVGIWTQNGYFSGEIHITNGEGLENLEEWQAVAQQISDAWEKALKAETDASNAQYTADEAVLQAERIELMLARINSDTVLDIAEKKVLRTEWITINGLEDLDRSGEKGSYIKTKQLYSQYSNLGGRVLFTYGGKAYTFNGKAYTFVSIGIAALDAAYLALREYLSEVALNDRTTVFEGFDRQHLADLLTNYYDAEKQVNDNITAAVKERIEQAKAEVLAELTGFQEAIEQQIEEMQDVIDNTIETYFLSGAPSLVSPPADEWTTDELKHRHLGDLYYDNITGYAYRFQYNSSTGTYYWHYLEDSALAKALAAAAKAQDTADGKRRTFLSQPTAADAYDPGDMWLHATVGDFTNETLVCITAKAAGVSFSAAHWTKASKYTDDTVANAAAAAASAAQTTANNAANAAAAAQTAADNAAQAAATANTRLTNWASDGSISPVEKEALRQQKADVIQEYGEYINQANTYSVDTTAYASAYTAALAALNKYTAATPENITIEADYDNIAAYYTARTNLAQAIATAAKKVATDAQAAADAAQATANQAVGLANAAQVAANAAQAAANAAQADADAAAAAAAAAQQAADDAQDDADAANTRLNGWASNGSISPVEKEAIRQQKADIMEEYTDFIAQATTYGVSTTAYAAAYTAALAALNKYTAATPENITIEADYANIGAYYTARTTLSQAIATAAKKVATDAQAAADAAQTTANNAASAASAAQTAADAAQASADAAASAASTAQTAADNAASAAAAANTRLNGWASDQVISPLEKEALRQQKTDIQGEYQDVINQCTRYSVSSTAYTAAYTAAIAALNKYTAASPENITIGNDYADIGAYYTARSTVMQAVAAAAKAEADAAQAAADAAQAAADAAQADADAAQTAADAAQTAADNAATAAAAAQTTADNAATAAAAANTRLNGWASDQVISPLEKEALRQQKADIQGEYLDIINQCTRYNITSTAYAAAYTAAIAALNKYTATSPENIDIDSDYANIGAYYTARSTVMQAVAAAAKAEAEAAQAAADAAQADADAAAAAAAAAQGTANSALTAAQNAQSSADTAQAAANTAQAAANAAQADATAANTRLTNWADDGSISPVEKNSLKQQKGDIAAEYAGILQQAQAYALSTTAYTSAYEAAMTALNKYTAATPENITITSDYANIAAYYTARTAITQAIAAAAKAAADAAQTTADNAIAQAVRLKEALEHINSDDVLDIAEKKSLRTEWITINGLEDLDRSGSRGSYHITKQLLSQYTNLGRKTVFTFNGKVLTFNGKVYTFLLSGTGALDAAYLALREYLIEVGLNDRTTTFDGFDRQHLADLLTAYYDAERQVNDSISQAIKEDIEAAKAEVLAELGSFQALMEQQLEEMQDVVDNTIETHFAGGTPTLNNYPANEWTTEELKKRHLGDLYYDNAPKGSGSGQSPTSGFAFRFERTGTEGSYVYSWHQLNDNAIAQALAAAAAAQDTADGKRRTFLSQPTTADAYDPGDMWLHATIGNYTNETLVCLTAKAAGTVFQASHWGLASKYTDDTVANLARTEAAAAQSTATAAATAAAAAQQAADDAQDDADAANTRLNGWASNGSISPVEKEAIRQQKADIMEEYTDFIAQATTYGVSTTAYAAAYTAALAALNKYTAETPENITIEADYANIGAYYAARTTLSQTIATAAKKVATDAQAAADAAQTTANNAASAASAAQTAADAAQASADAAASAASTAQTAADNAATAAAAANTRLNGWASDQVISPLEKEALRQQKTDIQGEYQDVINQCTRYSVSSTAYTAAYTAAIAALNKYTAASPENITIGNDYADIGAYYTARSTVMQAVAAAAKKVATDAQAAADAAQSDADAAQAAADAAAAAASAAQTTANNAATAAAAAQTTADNAATAAAAANNRLNGWASDGSISPLEKEALRQQKADIQGEYLDIINQCTRHNVTSTAYAAAYTAAIAALNKYTAATPENITITSDYANIGAYYTARSTVMQAVAAAAKAEAEAAQAAADAAQAAADVADGKAEAAADAAAAVARAVANINDDTILDPSEKGEVRTTWISINGILSTSENGTTGTYAAAKEAIAKAAGAAFPTVFTFKGKVFTFNGKVYTFSYLGASALDAAYLALREFLSGLQINTPGYFLGFDRSQYSSLLRDYNVALNKVLQTLSDIATQKADDALSSIELINAVLEKFGSDGYISSQEKLTLKTALDDETPAHTTLQNQAARYNTQEVQTALAAYETAYTRFGNVVTYYCSNFPWADDVPVSSSYPLSYISAYYTAKEALINAINAAEKAIIDTKAANSDYSYLRDALPNNAFTQVTGGLVLSNILGVKNANGNVVAAMNGLATLTGFNDATHGVLMFAAGITDVSTAKTTAATRIFSDGTIITNKLQASGGEIINLLTRQLRNPFRVIDEDSFTPISDDNVFSEGLGAGSIRFSYSLDWSTASSGRRQTVIGAFTVSAPSGKYFYENGRRYREFKSSYEVTEFLGYGTTTEFYGWIVISRTLFCTNRNFGRNISPIAFGKVSGVGSSASFSIIKYQINRGAGDSIADADKVSSSEVMKVLKVYTGRYYIYVPRAWFVSANYIYIDLVGVGTVDGAGNYPVKATLYDITESNYANGYPAYRIEIWVSDDETINDGNFLFRLYNMAQWDD